MTKVIEYRSYNDQLNDPGDLPKIRIVGTPDKIENSGGSRVIIAPQLDYDKLMKTVPEGKLITNDNIKDYLAEKYNADYTCPVSSRKFIVLAAYASVERGVDETPYWRTLKKHGELNGKYPGGINEQKRLLEMEGHLIIQNGKHYYVMDFEEKQFQLK
jgi:alkylated DNA nucleotide flippase Atl1